MTDDERRRDQGSEQENPDAPRKNAEEADARDPTDEIDIHTADTLPPGSVDREELIARMSRGPSVARTVTAGGSGAAAPPSARIPDQIGRYKILGLLGEGGMGVVYEAEQPEPRRRVALKVIRGGAFVDETRLRLFQREAETLARLKHPNIAAIYESGRTDDGEHFFAMELVQGQTLLDWLQARPKTITPDELRLRLFLFRQIAEAVHYAHQRGVIHRDLKPANVIVSDETASPDLSTSAIRAPAVKILDFGLARITEGDMQATMTTEVGAIKGTLPYMSPEQARGRPEAIDLRTDVYALGVVLYEMLAGKLPYDVEVGGVPEALRVICEENPGPLSQTWSGVKRLDPDVETIVGKALEKEADRRYQSAVELAADVDRYLASQPILARPPSTIYQLRKFARRNRVLVGGVLATFVVLVAGIIGTGFGMFQAREQARIAEEALNASEASRLMMLAGKQLETDPTRALAHAIAILERDDTTEVRRFALETLWRGPTYFRMGWEGFWDGQNSVNFSPDGEWLSIGTSGLGVSVLSGTTALWRPGGDPPKLLTPEGLENHAVFELVFAPGSESLFIGAMGETTVRQWSIDGGELIRSLEYGALKSGRLWGHYPMHISSDGSKLTTKAWRKEEEDSYSFHLLSWSTDAEEPALLGTNEDFDYFPSIDPTGRLFADTDSDGRDLLLRTVDGSTWGPARPIGDHEGEEIMQWEFDRDGTHLASGDAGGGIRVWSTRTPTEGPLHTFDGPGEVQSLEFDPSASALVSAYSDGSNYLWSLDAPASIPPLELVHHLGSITGPAFHPNGRWLATGGGYRHAMIWPLDRAYPRVLLHEASLAGNTYRGFAVSPDGTWIAARLQGPLRRIPLTRDAGLHVETLSEEVGAGSHPIVVFDPAGRYLVAGGEGLYFMPLPEGEPRKLPGFLDNVPAVAVSHDGRLIAAGGGQINEADQFIRVWNTETWEHQDVQVGYSVTGIDFTPDDDVIFRAKYLYRWNRIDPAPEYLLGLEHGIGGDTWSDPFWGRVDVSPDGRYVMFYRVLLDLDGLDAVPRDLRDQLGYGIGRHLRETGVLRVLRSHPTGQGHRVFDPTGTVVVSGGYDGIIRVGPVTGEEPHWLIGQGYITQVAVSPDGKWILSSGDDGTLRLWPMPDLDEPPLQTLPREELLAILRAQTNLRVTPADEAPANFNSTYSATGYSITWENPAFESWDDTPPIWGPPAREP